MHNVHVEIRKANMNRMPIEKRAQIIGLLVEGMSLRAASRLADCSINTVTKLLEDVGAACWKYQDENLRNLNCKRIQCDEIWSFIGCKEKNVPSKRDGEFGLGDVWTWTAIDAETKLIPCFAVGGRDATVAHDFMNDLASRLANRVQLTTDGHKAYLHAVERAFGSSGVDYAMLVKLYGEAKGKGPDRRYSSGECCSSVKMAVRGNPQVEHVSTSYVERANLTMRMSMRRFTRLSNGFSKKFENHVYAIALHFMYYNFGRVHKSLRVTPAMEAGVAKHVWSLEEIAALVPDAPAKKRGSYKQRATISN
jgi:IS1 family transposase/predicted HTH domain antitoxin